MTRFVASQLAHDHWFSSQAAKSDLGYEPIASMEQCLEKTLPWLRRLLNSDYRPVEFGKHTGSARVQVQRTGFPLHRNTDPFPDSLLPEYTQAFSFASQNKSSPSAQLQIPVGL